MGERMRNRDLMLIRAGWGVLIILLGVFRTCCIRRKYRPETKMADKFNMAAAGSDEEGMAGNGEGLWVVINACFIQSICGSKRGCEDHAKV